ncbi:MAG: class-III pyridoxal-phosphate-dependent aminotransferase [Promethearchaeota archaeon]
MEGNEKVIGTRGQRELVKLYSRHVSKAKASFFRSVGLGVVQGEREGIYIRMLEGSRKDKPPMELVDCRTSGGVFNLGHRHPAMVKALKDGLDGGLDVGDHHLISEQRALLAEQLAGLMPGDITKTQYCVGGGEAIDLAIKLARAATGRKKVVSAKGGYHGVTGLALAAGDPKFKDAFGWKLLEFQQVEFGDIDALRGAVDGETACVILETIPATGGILVAPRGYFAEVRELCDERGVVFVADEVQAGLGRTGRMWAIHGGLYEDEKVVPDAIVLAKGMSGGVYPMATCSYRPFLDGVFEEDPFIHISTTGGSELGCYVTRKMLDIVSDPAFLEHVREVGSRFGRGLEAFKDEFPGLVVDVRGRGLMWGLEFPDNRYGIGYTLKMIENGIFADYCGNNEKVVKLMPPLVVEPSEVDLILERLERAMRQIPAPK